MNAAQWSGKRRTNASPRLLKFSGSATASHAFYSFISVNVFFTHIGQSEQCYSKVVSGINYEQDLAMAFSLIFLSSIYVYIYTYRNWYVDT
jgi:hypothetical protein